ncbi:MAG: M20/M25/M40 family metallo-hydrolase [Desulfotalea sp.]
MNINKERLATSFTELCQINSPSKQERVFCQHLKEIFENLGASEIHEDESADKTGADCGNLIINFPGNGQGKPIMLACHMDTVQPGENILVSRDGDIFTSAGETILGADDKAGIAAIIETLNIIKDNNWQHKPIELVFTTCEEIGLLGAYHLDYTKIESRLGIALDSSTVNTVITNAPSANRFTITVHGLAAHAGISPETGVSAIQIAGHGIAGAKVGRLDEESTANIGVIEGGLASNIITNKIVLNGEVRSHDEQKLKKYTNDIINSFRDSCDLFKDAVPGFTPSIEVEIQDDYQSISIPADSPIIDILKSGAEKSNKTLKFEATGGGSDANVFNQHGIETVILGTGMDKVHSTQERVTLSDMVELSELLLATICPK